jgi:cell wall-associated NlpC family hydrolase
MLKILFSVILLFSSFVFAETKYLHSYTKRDKKLKLDELFATKTIVESESVFEDTPKNEKKITGFSFASIASIFSSSEDANPKSPEIQSNKLKQLLDCAFEMIGTKYSFGATNESSKTDCSLYTQNVFKKVGINLPRSSADQSSVGESISLSDIKVGDLLFFRTYKEEPSHVGIYIGNNKMIHASFKQGEVIVDDISKGYFQKRFLFAKRHNL